MLRGLFTQPEAGFDKTAPHARGASAVPDESLVRKHQGGVDRPVAGWYVRDPGGEAVNGELWTRQSKFRAQREAEKPV
jgi:hypothetical protein